MYCNRFFAQKVSRTAMLVHCGQSASTSQVPMQGAAIIYFPEMRSQNVVQ